LILEDYLIKHKKEVQKTAFMYCVHMYINGNLWGGRIKENDGEGEFKYDIFDIL
jgi:hypothetical protein